MKQNADEKKFARNNSSTWPALVTREARRSVFIHGAVFAVINALLLTVNHLMGRQFVEWPLGPWAGALAVHAAVVIMAHEIARVRVKTKRINAAGLGCR